MNMSGKAPTSVVWIICLVLYIVALVVQFGGMRADPQLVTWSWIIGFGLLLLACRVNGLWGGPPRHDSSAWPGFSQATVKAKFSR